MEQKARYDEFYGSFRTLRWMFRFDVRYRCRRLHEVFAELGIDVRGQNVLDVGFGGGHLLASFPRDCTLVGADVSRSAVTAAQRDPVFAGFRDARFVVVDEAEPDSLPVGPFDVVVSSHTLEHVPDDAAALAAWRQRMARGAILAVFVPIEEPDYVEFHRRCYSVQTILERVHAAGFDIVHHERSMFVNGHVWKLLTIPSRRHWPVVASLADALRLGSLSAIPYPALRVADSALYKLGVGPRQALVIARRP
jgi:SAM-dependent methyltransferase